MNMFFIFVLVVIVIAIIVFFVVSHVVRKIEPKGCKHGLTFIGSDYCPFCKYD